MMWQQLIRTICWQAAGFADAAVQGPEPADGDVSKAAAAQAAHPRRKSSAGTCLESFS